MAENETFAAFSASNTQKPSATGYNSGTFTVAVPNTNFRGIGVPKTADVIFAEVVKISAGATLTAGVKIDLVLVDDGMSANDLGKVVRFGAIAKLLTSGSDNLDMATSAGTEQTVDVTLDATKGEVVIGTITIANANLDSAAAGNHIALQLRRIGTHANDTCNGRVVLLKASAYAY